MASKILVAICLLLAVVVADDVFQRMQESKMGDLVIRTQTDLKTTKTDLETVQVASDATNRQLQDWQFIAEQLNTIASTGPSAFSTPNADRSWTDPSARQAWAALASMAKKERDLDEESSLASKENLAYEAAFKQIQTLTLKKWYSETYVDIAESMWTAITNVKGTRENKLQWLKRVKNSQDPTSGPSQ